MATNTSPLRLARISSASGCRAERRVTYSSVIVTSVESAAPYWFSDGYAGYLRHFNWTMGALPQLAPVGENHILRSSSIIQKVTYGPGRASYTTFVCQGT
jgi:hypothetical protein